MRRKLTLIAILLLPSIAGAQEVLVGPPEDEALIVEEEPEIARAALVDEPAVLQTGFHFLVALLAGFILAIAFELVLTNLSLAIGLNVVGPFGQKEPSKKGGGKPTSVHKTSRKITAAFGIWTLLTASIALFFAAWLATALGQAETLIIGIALGLAIWGLFSIAMVRFELSAVSTLAGSLFSTAAGGLRAAYEATTSLFSKSEASRAGDMAEDITRNVKKELLGHGGAEDMRHVVQGYIQQLKPKPHRLREELSGLLEDHEIRLIAEDDGSYTAELLSHEQAEPGKTRKAAQEINTAAKSLYQTVREEASRDKDVTSKAVDTAIRTFTDRSGPEAEWVRGRFETYLRESGREELDPDGIRRDLETLYHDPRTGLSRLADRLSHLDRESAVKVLAQREDMTEEEARRRVDRFFDVIDNTIKQADTTREQLRQKLAQAGQYVTREADELVTSLRSWVNRSEDSAGSLVERLRSMDREDLKTMIAGLRRDWTKEDVDHVIDRLDETRHDLIARLQHAEDEVKRRLDEAEQEALHQVDEVRRTSATAAWWAFATAVVSGAAACVGGIIGVLF